MRKHLQSAFNGRVLECVAVANTKVRCKVPCNAVGGISRPKSLVKFCKMTPRPVCFPKVFCTVDLLPQIGEKATLLPDQWKHNGGAKADAHSATLAHNAIAYRHQRKSSPFSIITYTCLPSYPTPPPFNTRPIPPSCLSSHLLLFCLVHCAQQ